MAQTTKTKYVHPEVLVDTQWVEEHLEDKNVRIVESYLPVNKHYYSKKILDLYYVIHVFGLPLF